MSNNPQTTYDFFDEYEVRSSWSLPWDKTAREADVIEKMLKLQPEDRILDVPCGFGRHCIELALRGYNVTGMELNALQIEHAKEMMKKKGVNFEIVPADMRSIPHKCVYTKLVNFFTSFGYFSDEENLETLRQFHAALKTGGMILMHMSTREGIILNLQPHSVKRTKEGWHYLEERRFDPINSRIRNRRTIVKPGGEMDVKDYEMRLYSPRELLELLKSVGFEIAGVYNEKGGGFDFRNRRVIVTGRKG